MIVRIPCRPTEDLDWSPILTSLPCLDKITWEFDLGLDDPYFPLEDELHFSSLKLALARFSKDVWPNFFERTLGAILYRGSADFSLFFRWSASQEENWNVWKAGRPNASEPHLLRLFAADTFALYFQMLSHALPDELPLILHFDSRGCGSLAEKRQLLSKERFEHFQIVTQDSNAHLALCMPPEELCSSDVLGAVDRLLSEIKEPYRVVEEAFLTESWEGIDRLFVVSQAVSRQGMRKLMGFCAAGGLVISVGELLNLPEEISYEEYKKELEEKIRGRGI